jgi:hypothetical protein
VIDVSFFGSLVGALGSAISVVLLLVALASTSFLAATGIEAARRVAPLDRGTRAVGVAVGLAALVLALAGLRVGPGEGELVPTLAVSVAAAAALGSSAACAWVFAARALSALGAAQKQRFAAVRLADEERRRAHQAAQRTYFEGEDLRAEVARAEVGIEGLRAALGSLVATSDALQAKLEAAEGGGDAALIDEVTRARDQVAVKIELGQRVLAAAEGAAFRLACNAPLRLLLRRRPRAATQALAGMPAHGPAIDAAAAAIAGFLGEVRGARVRLSAVEMHRPASQGAGGEDDPPAQARRELDAMESAYGALLERLSVAQLRLTAAAGAQAMESAAGTVSGVAAASVVNPAEIGALVTEVARAEAAVAVVAPEAPGPRQVAEALAAGSVALERSDAASLWDLITALREVR